MGYISNILLGVNAEVEVDLKLEYVRLGAKYLVAGFS